MSPAHCIIRGVAETGATGPAVRLPHGTAITYSTAGRSLLERDRHGHETARLSWRGDALARAEVRIPDDSWLTIEPAAVTDAPWGPSDRLWHHDTPLTVFAALDYARIGFIPPLAAPAALPPGAGTAVLNLLAGLAADQQSGPLAYQGPYPSEELFLALLESFHYCGDGGDPLQAFREGKLAWTPAPHERVRTREGVWVHLREGVEKVTWAGRRYYRPSWQGVARRTERRVRDAEGAVICSLWAFDEPLEDHLRLDTEGENVHVLAAEPPPPWQATGPPALLEGLAAVVAARTAPALGPFIAQGAAELTLVWAPLAGDLVTLRDGELCLSNRLPPLLDARRRAAGTGEARMGVALAFLAELAHLAGDLLRRRAQASLAARPEAEQRRVLEADQGLVGADVARAIAAAVQALVGWKIPTRSRGGSG
jgi:hypothetical protein